MPVIILPLTCICVDMTCTAIGSMFNLCTKLDNPSDLDPISFDEIIVSSWD